jgi:hypothetical protein
MSDGIPEAGKTYYIDYRVAPSPDDIEFPTTVDANEGDT